MDLKNKSYNYTLSSVAIFLIFAFASRFVYPFGDEPDFSVRSFQVVYQYYDSYFPYSFLTNLTSNFDIFDTCRIVSSPTSLWAQIEPECGESINQKLIRYLITIITLIPIFLLLIFKNTVIRNISDVNEINNSPVDLNKKIEALSLSIMAPSIVFALGFLAVEQFTLVLSLIFSVFLSKITISIILIALVSYLDQGNGILLATFYIFTYFNKKFFYSSNSNYIYIIILLLYISIIYFKDFLPLNFSFIFDFFEKGKSIQQAVIDQNINEKYPLILRPLITYMSYVFMTASGIKIIPLYIFFAIVIFIGIQKLKYFDSKIKKNDYNLSRKNKNEFYESLFLSLNSLLFILLSVFMLPSYSNAKYYLFLMPIFLRTFLYVFDYKSILYFFCISNIIVFVFLLIYRI